MSDRDMKVEEFCDRHDACNEGRQWALINCKTMQEAWDTAKPTWVLWIATRPGVLTNRELRKLAVRFARTVQHLTTDPRSVAALDVADKHADGLATDAELADRLAQGPLCVPRPTSRRVSFTPNPHKPNPRG